MLATAGNKITTSVIIWVNIAQFHAGKMDTLEL